MSHPLDLAVMHAYMRALFVAMLQADRMISTYQGTWDKSPERGSSVTPAMSLQGIACGVRL
jgi:hypothetical protein